MEIIFILFIALILIIIATVKFKVHPVYSLIIASIAVGFLFGFDSKLIVKSISEGFGKTLSSIGLIIAFGTTIGIFLENNGGTKVIAEKILNSIPVKRSPLPKPCFTVSRNAKLKLACSPGERLLSFISTSFRV